MVPPAMRVTAIVAGDKSQVGLPSQVSVNFTGTTPRLTVHTLDPSALIGGCTCAAHAGVGVGVGVGLGGIVAVAVAVGVAVAVAVAVAVGVGEGVGVGLGSSQDRGGSTGIPELMQKLSYTTLPPLPGPLTCMLTTTGPVNAPIEKWADPLIKVVI
jgi:hypothetical protein